MGGSTSKVARRVSGIPNAGANAEISKSSVSASSEGRKVRKVVPIPSVSIADLDTTRRQKGDEWAETLKTMSNIISSSAWDTAADEGPASKYQGEHGHPAQRSSAMRERLPSSRNKTEGAGRVGENGELHVKTGKLLQEDVVKLFHLHRQDPQRWGAQQLSEKFKVELEDVRDLLKFTRTYMARTDNDGVLRAYYNPSIEKSISRFESN